MIYLGAVLGMMVAAVIVLAWEYSSTLRALDNQARHIELLRGPRGR